VVDHFRRLDGWGDPFREAGHEVFIIDLDRRCLPQATVQPSMNVLQ